VVLKFASSEKKKEYISVTEKLENEGEIEEFLKLLDEKSKSYIHITFYNAFILNDKVIEKLVQFQKNGQCEIYVIKPYLYCYMNKLGIKCKYAIDEAVKFKKNYNEMKDLLGELDEKEVICFLKNICSKYGYDYTEYQVDSIIRRIKVSMLRANVLNFNDFKSLILQNKNAFEQLFLDFSINTTEFFRDPEVFMAIKNSIFPYLSYYKHIKIWCVGCSTGKEPYSLAILLKEAGLLYKTQIYATDINPYVIEEAKNGLYSIEDIEESIKSYRKADGKNSFTNYFELKQNYMKVKEEIKKYILFFQHSALEKGIINEFQLILCRNVLIYFNINLQRRVLEYLNASMNKSGFLVLEKSGGMLQNEGYNYFNKYDDLNKIYRIK
jgi:chemotaxis protein methyltransferase CheR